MNLTDEEIRIKVAEAMGWKVNPVVHNLGIHPQLQRGHHILPDYPADLNACAEFEATLTEMEQTHYTAHLIAQCGDVARESRNLKFVRLFYQITATARQRCLAYLKTKGLIP